MKRETHPPRADWQQRVESVGLIWHTADGEPYWNEEAHYRFTPAQIAEIEGATLAVYELFLKAGQAIVDDPHGLEVFGIPELFHAAIREAWNAEPPALNFGRFDFGYDGTGSPKLFEFNCDTPTSLLEAAVVQWAWKEEVFPQLDQFNSIHETLIARWRELAPHIPDRKLWFAHANDPAGEDTITVSYLRDTAQAGGLTTEGIVMDDIGWHSTTEMFVDLDERQLRAIFKLYPWEWLANEQFGQHLVDSLDRTLWLEPVWKMIWSNKAILPVLWSMFPDHPNLLPAYFSRPEKGDFVQKPILAREGANVAIVRDGKRVASSGGDYGAEGYIYQDVYALPETAPGVFPVIGSWIIDGAPVGMGIREDGLITGNKARFVPHVIDA